jgi:phenylacetate-coenzyme A ligase PaaK-like adenylate-forming protein
MFETALAQMRFAASIFFGLPFNPRSLDRLVDGLIETQREFGAFSDETARFVNGPVLDDETRQEVQLRAFRRQAVLGARETPYYKSIFESVGLRPEKITYNDLLRIPLTSKTALKESGDDFVNKKANAVYQTMTTGTTGTPTRIWFSHREMQSFFSLFAIGLLMDGSIREGDIVQVTTSSRATLGNTCFIEACSRLGAVVYQTGLLDPQTILAHLTKERNLPGKKNKANVLNTYPSYLGILTEYALKHRYQPNDFGLSRIMMGGEIVTKGLMSRAQAVFGPVTFSEGYGMTEPWPFGGTLCDQGHLHYEPSQGLMEVLHLDDQDPAQPEEPGRLVLTPFLPFRETTILLRYDTEDVVRVLTEPYTCSLHHLQATSNILGKLKLSVKHEMGWVFPRQVLEALEAVKAVPLPARCSFWAVGDGIAVEVVASDDQGVRDQITQSLEERGVPLRKLYIRNEIEEIKNPYPWRGDLTERAFNVKYYLKET